MFGLGPLTIGKKAAKFGYKRYGIPGAVMAGSAGAVGYIAVRRAVKAAVERKDVSGAIDAGTIQSAVDEKGIDAITDRETLESAIDEEKLGTDVDIDEVQSTTEEETDELDETAETDENGASDADGGDESGS
ncbi:hypothetical protein BG842_08650 [Haladaptatus sp. W1]|uniref:hypothetical protein n=1 Tax=Haladaptatus sp. W1 TaxID=1897478 RepID=UPI0008498CE4|nr:hypothetical protein [Haladaptatus sp. W1]ODR81645.1 hypothetical protein BG842_08650 [Haladaptatus sp. W1]